MTMKYRLCGNSDFKLPILGCGCWAFGGGEYWGSQNQKDVDEVVAKALDLGVNYFDTAEVYNKGASEASLGIAIKNNKRSKAIIGTKVSPHNCYPDALEKSCEASLRRLGTDYIDIYMIHWPVTSKSICHFTEEKKIIDNPPYVSDAFGAMNKLRQQGKIRYIGVSNFAINKLSEAISYCPNIVVNELPYSLLTRAIEIETLPSCTPKGVGVIGYMTLLQGMLADIFPSFDEISPWQRRTRHFDSRKCKLCRHGEHGAEGETAQAIDDIRRIAKDSGISMPDIAIKWAVANFAISCALVGVRNTDELENNVQAVSEPLPTDIVERLNTVTKPLMDKLGSSFDYYESGKNDRTR